MYSKPKWPQVVAEFLVDNLTILLTIGFIGAAFKAELTAGTNYGKMGHG